MFDLLLITPELAPPDVVRSAEVALSCAPAGRVALQLRAKQLEPAARSRLAHDLRALTSRVGAPLFLNSDLELAADVGADGVQLPERGPSVQDARARLGQAACIGASRHDAAGMAAAEEAGATFVLLSPVFEVPGKGPALGLAGFAAIARTQPALPVVALGGITAGRAASVLQAGARAVAVVREVLQAERPDVALAAILSAIDTARAR